MFNAPPLTPEEEEAAKKLAQLKAAREKVAAAVKAAAKAEDAGASRRRWRDDMSLTHERLLEALEANARYETHVAAADALGLETHAY